MKDDTGNGILKSNAGWSFDLPPENFESHIEQSIPHYKACHDLIAKISDFFLPDNAVVYDIGTTTGAVTRGILQRHPGKKFSITGLDVIPAMVDYATKKTSDPRASFICTNALDYDYEKSHLIILYYTLQFIHPSVRVDLLKKIYDRLHWGGALILFEKVRAPDARFQDYMGQIYTEFKMDNSFSPKQIINIFCTFNIIFF